MTRPVLGDTPDGVANVAWLAGTIAAAPMLGGDGSQRPSRPDPATQRRATVNAALAVKLLDAHLRNRVQLMQRNPTDLSGVSPPEADLLIRAMAAAGHADGGLEHAERQRLIVMARSGIADDAERARLLADIETPPSIEVLVRLVQTPQSAERFYAVSAAVLRRDRPTARAYLGYLAARLEIPADMVLRINRELEMPAAAR